MSRFADAFYYLALLSPDDVWHGQAVALSRSLRDPTVTTAFVLTEVADALCAPGQRGNFARLWHALQADPDCLIIPASQELLENGIALYEQRPDKGWSLTDCVSFIVMRQHDIIEALTGDHHFEQAGFRISFK